METKKIKNIPFSTPVEISELVAYQEGQVVSKTISQNRSVSMTIFAFAKDEEISSHASDGDAFVHVLDGTARITIGELVQEVTSGQVIVMPAGIPHALYAAEPFKMLLVVVF